MTDETNQAPTSAEPAKAADDVKSKFREALERKNKKHTDIAGELEAEGGPKIHHEHGPAAAKRTFRRKSG